MAVDGGGKGHDVANLAVSAGIFCAGTAVEATAATAAIATGVTIASGVSLLAGAIYYNYKYAPRTAPKNAHYR